jgi:hypothetical protein
MPKESYEEKKRKTLENIRFQLERFRIQNNMEDIERVYNILENYFLLTYLGSKDKKDISPTYLSIFTGKGPGSLFDIEKKTIKVFTKNHNKNIRELSVKDVILSVITRYEFDKAVENYDLINPSREVELDDYDDYDNKEILGFDMDLEPADVPDRPITNSMEDVDGGKRKTRNKKRKNKTKKSIRKSKKKN